MLDVSTEKRIKEQKEVEICMEREWSDLWHIHYPTGLPVLNVISSSRKGKWLQNLWKSNILMRNISNIIARGAHYTDCILYKKGMPFSCPDPNIMTGNKEVICTHGSIPVWIFGYQTINIVLYNNGHVLIWCSLHSIKEVLHNIWGVPKVR